MLNLLIYKGYDTDWMFDYHVNWCSSMTRNSVCVGTLNQSRGRTEEPSLVSVPPPTPYLMPRFDLLQEQCDGIFTDSFSFFVEDFDECEAHEDNCGQHATCVNNDGSFECKCKDGFEGDGISCEGK